MDLKNEKSFIKKNLDQEGTIEADIAYFRMQGASEMENYRAPNSYVFLLFKKCSGTHTVDFIEYKQQDLQVHISFPGQIHSWVTGNDAVGYKLIISKELIEQSPFASQFASIRSNRYPVIDLNIESFKEIEAEFLSISQELEREKTRASILNLKTQLVTALVNNLIEQYTDKIIPISQHPILSKFDMLIQEHYKTHKKVKNYADLLFISSNYLNTIVRQHLNMSAKEIINKRILLEGKRLLQGSNMSIKEITFYLGFATVSHFSNFIKEKTGFKPSHYRK